MATVNHLLTDANTAVSPRTTGAFVPTAGSLMLAFTFSSGTAVGFGTFSTNNGIAFVKAGTSAAAGGNAHALHCFVATSTSNAVSQTATFNSVGDQSTGNIIFIFEVIGASGTGTSAIEQTAKQDNQAGPSTPAPAFSVAASSANVIAGCVGIEGANPATITEPSGWTERGDTGYATPTTGAEYATLNSGFSGTTVTWGSSESIYCSMIVEIKAAVAVPNLIYMNTRRRAAHRFLTIR
jgi:hypothetical protein